MTEARSLFCLLLLGTAPAASTQSLCNPCVDPPVRNTRPVTGLMPGERHIIDAEEYRRLSAPARQPRFGPFDAMQLRDIISDLEEYLEELTEASPQDSSEVSGVGTPEAGRRLRLQESLRGFQEQLQNMRPESELTEDGNDD